MELRETAHAWVWNRALWLRPAKATLQKVTFQKWRSRLFPQRPRPVSWLQVAPNEQMTTTSTGAPNNRLYPSPSGIARGAGGMSNPIGRGVAMLTIFLIAILPLPLGHLYRHHMQTGKLEGMAAVQRANEQVRA